MADQEKIFRELEKLIKKYYLCKKEHKDLSEANVRGALIDPFFNLLGWTTDNPNEYDRETYVRIGYADISLKKDGNPVVFIEAKKFGAIPSRSESTIQINLEGKKVIADWTEEERQVLNYAATDVGVKWAILTNFEKFRLFNARTGEIVLNIENPGQYLEYIEEISLLEQGNVYDKTIDILADRPDRPDVDITFLELLKKWRILIANNIFQSNKMELDKLNLYVQRILDRLIIIRFAEDNWILSKPDQLKAVVYDPWIKSDYAKLTDNLVNFFNRFDDFHNSKIFEKDSFLDEIIKNMDDNTLGSIIDELYYQSFRKFNSDILGSTYESYLSYKIELEEGVLILKLESESKKGRGIFYTPPYVVDHIIENTLGKTLDKFWKSVQSLFDRGEYELALNEFGKINDIKILDPSCGSGSFLIKAHDMFLNCYKNYELEYKKAKNQFSNLIESKEKDTWEIMELDEKLKSPLRRHEKKILKNNLYGVDLDETAAEIASVNLMLRAMKKNEKLPLILYENIKVGNSLITGVDDADELLEHSDKIKKLIELREKIRICDNPKKKVEYELIAKNLKDDINCQLNENLMDFHDNLDNLSPFNWEIEFPEVFFDSSGNIKENPGFDIVIGNPPWGAELEEYEKSFISDYYNCVEYQVETYVAFMERSYSLLKDNGYFGFITTSPWLTYFYYKKIRELLITETTFEQVILLRYMAFNKVTAETTIFTYQKSPAEPDHLIKITALNEKSEFNDMEFANIEQSYWKEKYETGFNVLYWDKLDLVHKITLDTKKLENDENGIAEITVGIKPYQKNKGTPKQKKTDVDNRVYDSDHQLGPEYKQYIVGANIQKYCIIYPNGQWINYGDFLAEPRKSVNFESKKIVLRQTSPTIIASVDEKGYLNLNNVLNVVILNEDEIQYKYLLALLNSRIIDFMYKYFVPEDGKPFPEVKPVKIAELPIKSSSLDCQERIAQLITDISTLNYQKIELIRIFSTLVKNLNQDKIIKKLKDYVNPSQAKYYSINLAQTTRLIDDDVSCVPRQYYVKKEDKNLTLSLRCENNAKIDIIRLNFDDEVLSSFFYILIYLQVFNVVKRYRKEKNVIETVLTDIKVPKSGNNHSDDVKNIKNLMQMLDVEYEAMIKDKYPQSPIQDLDLKKILDKIDEIDEMINQLIYQIYDLNDQEKNVVENTISTTFNE